MLYISPLRALAFDVEKNLRAPLDGHPPRRRAPRRAVPRAVGRPCAPATRRPRIAQALSRRPADLLITTPESLYLMLTSNARDTLGDVETVIIDEIHAMATTKRGAHLMLSLERLEALTSRPAAAHRAVGHAAAARGGRPLPRRATPTTGRSARSPSSTPASASRSRSRSSSRSRTWATSAATGAAAARSTAPARSIWPSIYPRILAAGAGPPHHDHLLQRPAPGRAPGRPAQRAGRGTVRRGEGSASDEPHRGSSRSGAEAGPDPELVQAHHGSLAREQRIVIEDQLKRGELRAIVATSSRARHRHGRGRSRHPGRVARRGVTWPAAHRPCRATRSASRAGARSSPSTAATCSRRRSSSAGCSTG